MSESIVLSTSPQPCSSSSDRAVTHGEKVKDVRDEALLSIATCQSRRVYGTVDKGDGTVKIMEWEWVSDNQYREMKEFNKTIDED